MSQKGREADVAALQPLEAFHWFLHVSVFVSGTSSSSERHHRTILLMR
jgi:hypothetical protein